MLHQKEHLLATPAQRHVDSHPTQIRHDPINQVKLPNLSISQRDFVITLLQIQFPDIPVLICHNQFKQGLVCIDPVCLTNGICSQAQNSLIRALQALLEQRHTQVGWTNQRNCFFIYDLIIQVTYADYSVFV